MPITFPFPVRVSVGLVLTGVEHLRSLPTDLPTLGVSAVGQAMRLSMRVQQEFAELAVRGDEVLSRIGGAPPEHPSWATFDEEEADPSSAPAPRPVVAIIDGDGDGAAIGVLVDDRDDDDGFPGEVEHELAQVIALDLAASVRSTPPTEADPTEAGPTEADPTEADKDEDDKGETDDASAVGATGPDSDETETAEVDPARTLPTTDGAGESAGSEAELNGGADDLDYDTLTLAQLRGTLRRLSVEDVAGLLDRERTGADRPAFVTLLTNRLTSLEQAHP